MERHIAIVLAAGQGKRMGTSQKKQYLLLHDKPILYYSLQAFEKSQYITDIILVVGTGEESYVQQEIVNAYHFGKVCAIVEGGKERYQSVANGIRAIEKYVKGASDTSYVWVHDGARPFLDEQSIERAYTCVRDIKACVVGMPVKDTVKIADSCGYIATTPNRNLVWQIQTPQVFDYYLIKGAYIQLLEEEMTLKQRGISITDDAMVVETFTNHKVGLVEGNYKNIKITTPEDLEVAQVFYKEIM